MSEHSREETPEEMAAFERGFRAGAKSMREEIAAAANAIAARWGDIKSPVAKTVATALEALRDAMLEGPPPAAKPAAEDDIERARRGA